MGNDTRVGTRPPTPPPPDVNAAATTGGTTAADDIRAALDPASPPPTFTIRSAPHPAPSPVVRQTGLTQSFEILRTFEPLIESMEEWIEEEWLPSFFILIELAKVAHRNPEHLFTVLTKANSSRLSPVARDKLSALTSLFLINKRVEAIPPLPPMEVIESIRYLADEARLRTETLANFDKRMIGLESAGFKDVISEPALKRWQKARTSGRGLMHDVNNIITGILGWSSFAIESVVYHGRIKAAEYFFKRMKSFSIDTVESAMNMCTKLYGTRAVKNGIELAVEKNEDVEIPNGLRFKLFRAMSELILNGIKNYDENNPPYDSQAREQTEGFRYVRAEYKADGEFLTVTVSDNGVGMTEEEAKRALLEGETIRPEVSGGHGLGLSTVKAFAEAHGGSLEMISRKGVGTTARLTVNFPATQPSTPTPGSTPPYGGTTLPGVGGGSGMPSGCLGGGGSGDFTAMTQATHLALAGLETQIASGAMTLGASTPRLLAQPTSSSVFFGMPKAVGF